MERNRRSTVGLSLRLANTERKLRRTVNQYQQLLDRVHKSTAVLRGSGPELYSQRRERFVKYCCNRDDRRFVPVLQDMVRHTPHLAEVRRGSALSDCILIMTGFARNVLRREDRGNRARAEGLSGESCLLAARRIRSGEPAEAQHSTRRPPTPMVSCCIQGQGQGSPVVTLTLTLALTISLNHAENVYCG